MEPSPASPDTEPDPYAPPLAEPGTGDPDDDEPLNPWQRRSLLDWYGDLGHRGKLAFFGSLLVAANGVSFLFGFFMPKMLIVGIGMLCASAVIPRSWDD